MSDAGRTPRWPDDVFYIPVASADSDDPKAPDTSALPGTWSPDGEGCINYDDLTDRRWGVVDVDVTGYRLLIIDLDLYKLEGDERQRVVNGLEKAPDTRIHESQSGGQHVFYWIKEDELTQPRCPACDTEFDSVDEARDHSEETGHGVEEGGKLPFKLASGIDDKLNGYVLSTHCDGYEATRETQPAEISIDEVPDEWVKEEPSPEIDWNDVTVTGRGKEANVYDVIPRSGFPRGERVAHPFHGSDTGANFMVDQGSETFRCWRHEVTGDAIHLFGMKEGIISCGDWEHGGLSAEKSREILEAAENAGLIDPTDFDPEERSEATRTLEERDYQESIEEVDFPEDRSFVLDKPPREGGSYAMSKHFTNRDEDLLVLSSRHHILQAHTETIAGLVDRDECVVHLEGKQRVCDNPNGDSCPNRPEKVGESVTRVNDVRDVLHRKQMVTAEDCPDDLCPHWFLLQAAKYADVVVTVPQLFNQVVRIRDDSDADIISEPEAMNLMIDEEQTLSFFWPGSVDIAEIVRDVETDGTVSIRQRSANIKQQASVLRRVMKDVNERQEERKEEAEEEGRGWKRKSGEVLVEEALSSVEHIMEAIGTSDLGDELAADGDDPSLHNAIDILEERLEDVTLPDSNAQAETLIAGILEYCAPYFWRDEEDPSSTLESLAFPYEEQPFDFKRTSRDAYTLRLIGDREREPFYAEEIQRFQQIGVIAGPEGERFLDSVGLDHEPESITITDFRYSEDFLVLPVMKEVDDEGTPESVGKQRNRVEDVTRYLNEWNQPHIAVTGTKEQAASLSESLTKETSDVVGDPESPTATLYKLWTAGQTAIIYENSVVSRGIDAPIFDATTITSPGFATPYWESKKRHWKGEDDEKYRKSLAREMELKARELTNAALRMSTTREYEDVMGAKVIVVSQSDANKLKYLQDRLLPTFESAKEAADLVDDLTVGGGLDLTMADIRDGVSESEGDLMSIVLREELAESSMERDDYTLSEVEEMVTDDEE